MNSSHWPAVAASFLLCACAGSGSWPDFMPTLDPGLSVSTIATVLPGNVVIDAPSSAIPYERAKWSGVWSGWACQDQTCDTKLVVEKVTAAGADIIYSFASGSVRPYNARVAAQFVGDELHATLRNGAKISYRMRKQEKEVVEFKYEFTSVRLKSE